MSSASGDRLPNINGRAAAEVVAERKLCDCEGCTFRRFQMLAHVESQPENKMVCAALPEQNSPSVTTLQ